MCVVFVHLKANPNTKTLHLAHLCNDTAAINIIKHCNVFLSPSDDEDLEAMEAEILRGEKPPAPAVEKAKDEQSAAEKRETPSASVGEVPTDISEKGAAEDRDTESNSKLSKKAKKKKKKESTE